MINRLIEGMEWPWSLFVWQCICSSVALALLLLGLYKRRPGGGCGRLPPGPWAWPVIGNILALGTIPHQTLAGLRHKYGPVVWLKLGAVNTVVISSSKAAAEMFRNHDLPFSGRTITEAMRACSYNEGSMAIAQYGPYWRMLRRLCTMELFVNRRIDETSFLRRKSVDGMVRWLDEQGKTGGVQVGHLVFLMTFNLLGNLMLSRDLLDPQSKVATDFFSSMANIMELTGQPNVADFFPFLKWLDPQGIRKKMDIALGRALDIASGFVMERMQDQQSPKEERKKDFLDVLLEFEGNGKDEPAKISNRDLNILILEIFVAGTETTSSTIEWAMTELLRNPESMSKVREELAQVVGWNRKFEESDIDHLQYLQAVVKETLRLHPPIPFLIPRRVVQDTDFMGYLIPKDTQVFVNAWAIGRDPDVWDDPSTFKPERFLGSDIDYRGHHFELIPFGAGRRMCIGVPLAHRVLHLALGSLLHCFEWELDGHETPETIDMKERLGISLRKAVPLKVLPKKRTL